MEATTSVRLNQKLIKQARSKEKTTKRKAPKQIEYWAELGKLMEERLTPAQISAVVDGNEKVIIEPKNQPSLRMKDLLHSPLEDKSGQEWFQASQDIPGYLIRVSADGSRDLGQFADGKFILRSSSKIK